MSVVCSNSFSGSKPEFNSRESEWVNGGGGYHPSSEKSWKSFERCGHRSSRWCVLPGTLCLWTICRFSPIEVILTGLFHSSQLCNTWPLASKWSGFHPWGYCSLIDMLLESCSKEGLSLWNSQSLLEELTYSHHHYMAPNLKINLKSWDLYQPPNGQHVLPKLLLDSP